MFRGPPQTLALSVPLLIVSPPDATKYDSVVLTNLSPYSCAVTIAGPAALLAPWAAQLYDVPAGQDVLVTPQLAIQGGSTLDNTIQGVWYGPADPPPAGYPQNLTAQTGATNAQVVLNQQVIVASNAAPLTIDVPLPAWAKTVDIYLQYQVSVGASVNPILTVAGTTPEYNGNGLPYGGVGLGPWLAGVGVKTAGPLIFTVWGALDPTIALTFQPQGGAGQTVTMQWIVIASADNDRGTALDPFIVAPAANTSLPVSEHDPSPATPHSPFTVNVASATTAPILAAPAPNFYWEIVAINASSAGAATASNAISVQGSSSLSNYKRYQVVSGTVINQDWPSKFYCSEGLSAVIPAIGVTVQFDIIARQVPIGAF